MEPLPLNEYGIVPGRIYCRPLVKGPIQLWHWGVGWTGHRLYDCDCGRFDRPIRKVSYAEFCEGGTYPVFTLSDHFYQNCGYPRREYEEFRQLVKICRDLPDASYRILGYNCGMFAFYTGLQVSYFCSLEDVPPFIGQHAAAAQAEQAFYADGPEVGLYALTAYLTGLPYIRARRADGDYVPVYAYLVAVDLTRQLTLRGRIPTQPYPAQEYLWKGWRWWLSMAVTGYFLGILL